MRFPSLVHLAHRSRTVVQRFPWTMIAAALAAASAVAATVDSWDGDWWARLAMVIALGIPLTLALHLLAEERGWTPARTGALQAGGAALLVLFYLAWPGPERKHEALRYFQLSGGLHLLVATLPFLGQPESNAFWQYNRRLFQAILRAVLFSLVLFAGLAVALGALDQLFGIEVPGKLYGQLFLVIALVVNTAIFLGDVPQGLRELARDTSYPRVLQVFAQYILTPIVFVYLVLLLAYLIKILVGGEWPSGWIGWLVASVAAAGILGFLLVHPLRHDPQEDWIRTYTRWFFLGLIPAAAMLLVAFWKRVAPYGFTELRLLGLLLGVWLLAIAVSYTVRQDTGIRRIPVTLAGLLLLTLYGPLSLASVSVGSQGRRLHSLINNPDSAPERAREASAAIRFLLGHGARRQIAQAFPRALPEIPWDSIPDQRGRWDSIGVRILASAGIPYVAEYAPSRDGYFYVNAMRDKVTPLTGYEWMLEVSSGGTAAVAGSETVRVYFDTLAATVVVEVAHDTLRFDLQKLPSIAADSSGSNWQQQVPAEQLSAETVAGRYRGRLALEHLDGKRTQDILRIRSWHGTLFLGAAK